jgi:hypothetical protein
MRLISEQLAPSSESRFLSIFFCSDKNGSWHKPLILKNQATFRKTGVFNEQLEGLLIPPPFAPFSKPAHHLVGELHELNGWAIIILAAGHAAAALYHHYVLRDRVLSRMLPGARGRRGRKRDPGAACTMKLT